LKNKRIIGEIRLHRDGYGFVATGIAKQKDVFVPARAVSDALHTDLVEIKLVAGRAGKSEEGHVIQVVERRVKEMTGRLERVGKQYRVIADDVRVRRMIIVPDNKLNGAKHGQGVVVEITKYASGSEHMLGKVVSILGKRGDLDTEKFVITVRHHLSREFSDKVLKEADNCLSFMSEKIIKKRKDLRNIDFVTIDGETAKDFDDAVAVSRTSKGNIRLWVSIADVSYFVKENSVIDNEAYNRGTSVYFPGDCLPMLPEQLSNDLCSLKPKVDRLTMTVQMDIDCNGGVVEKTFYESVIRSKQRMTYTDLKKILVEKDLHVREKHNNLVPQFELMEECFKRLRKKRENRGAIDFDLPEPEIVVSLTGNVDDIAKADRHLGHMIIEEFMIAANEAVAEYLTEMKSNCVYRVHAHPEKDKINAFAILLHNLGYKISFGDDVSAGDLAKIVEMVKGKPEERLVNSSLLRSLAKAVYCERNLGHYGLASECYCHFTSPIRRYPDLLVHRFLKSLLRGEKVKKVAKDAGLAALKETVLYCTRRERIAMEAEREIIKLYVAFFMQDKIGDRYDGIISHITKFGFFVELNDFFVEGLVHKESLPKDNYQFDEGGYSLNGKHRKTKFRIGDPVSILVDEVNVPTREVYFKLI